MLIEFRVANFRSFRDTAVLSMVASADTDAEERAVAVRGQPPVRVLRAAALYGANASGKSNLVRAIDFMRQFVLRSTRERLTPEELARQPFRLDARVAATPSRFEVTVLLGEVRHRYGFAIDEAGIAEEWWFLHGTKARKMFERERQNVRFGESWKGEKGRLASRTRANALLLTTAAESDHEAAKELVAWFRGQLRIFTLDSQNVQPLLKIAVGSETARADIGQLLGNADTGIRQFDVQQVDSGKSELTPSNDGSALGSVNTLSRKEVYEATTQRHGRGHAGETLNVDFNLSDESEGTQRFLELVVPLAGVQIGRCAVIDELDARLHPLLLRQWLNLAMDASNAKSGQLIFVLHTTDLLTAQDDDGAPLLRRDQIWLTEKDAAGGSKLFSLADIRGVRKTEDIRSRYLRGLYGGVPHLTLQPGEVLRGRP